MGNLLENINNTKNDLKEEYSVEHIDAIETAIQSVKTAINALKSVDNQRPEDFKYFIGQLETFLSSDHGEAGLMAFKNNLLKRM